jgi:hypothetical protein
LLLILQTFFTLSQTSHLNKEANCTEPFPLVRVPGRDKPDCWIEGFIGGGEDGGAIFGIFNGLLEAAAKLTNVTSKLAQSTTLLLLVVK